MKKNFLKKIAVGIIFLCIIVTISFGTSLHQTYAADETLQGAKEMFDAAQNANKYDKVLQRAVYNDSGHKVSGALAVRDLIIEIVLSIRWVIMTLAVLFIVIAGTKIVTGGSEDASKKQLKVIRDIVIGIVIMNLAYFIVGNVFGTVTENVVKDANGQIVIVDASVNPVNLREINDKFAPILVAQNVVYPLVDFFLSFLAAFTILFLIISAFRIITAQGQEDKVKDAFRILLNTGLGLGLIVLAKLYVKAVFGDFTTATADATRPALNEGLLILMNVAGYILGFFVFIGVIMYIYAGVLVFFGGIQEGQRKKGISIALYTTLGIMVAIVSYTFVAAVVRLVP